MNLKTRRGEMLGIIVLILILLVGYVVFLNHEEKRVERYFISLRASAPDQYLDELKQVSGFEDFLGEYATLKGFDKYQSNAPTFLLGRWSLDKNPKRVSDSYESIVCANPMLIENGRLTFPDSPAPITGVKFRLRGDNLDIKLPSGKVRTIRIVASGVFLHHLELMTPGSDIQQYGYTCK